MGRDIDIFEIKQEDQRRFTERLYENLDALKIALAKPGFGEGEITLGAELESCIVDKRGDVSPINMELLSDLDDPLFCHEINKFNLEYNLPFVKAEGKPFCAMQKDAEGGFQKLCDAAKKRHANIALVGILPTLVQENFDVENMTDVGRYHMLNRELQNLRGGPFKVNMNGVDPLKMECDHITLEGANTSFQVHMRMDPNRFADTFNAAQLVTPIAVALSANSPICMGHRLWQESRIALFRHSIDNRHKDDVSWRQPSRISFGNGWVRESVHELFAETVALFPSIIPLIDEEDPFEALEQGRLPKLEELSLHLGTTWPWNRAVYSAKNEGHLRIEFRALPSGPSIEDMMASAAFIIGLTMGIRDDVSDILPSMPFRFAEHNFYRAAQSGYDARIIWPSQKQSELQERNITDVIEETLPLMEKGLEMIGVDHDEILKYAANIKERLKGRANGATWQLDVLEQYMEQGLSQPEACHAMTLKYIEQQQSGKSIIDWQTTI
ncbi:glutamate-cysteine ligase family protein [Pseudemcibacter aquimaris]|uniref:glutamate-cysteine ligase family protein n=1 Tax=Pseudemcibacter aquimaris TaxID=2857064 RepID=UPI0020131C38|nr:glutamate-cysteine ligase family protein [Pseudemcibacter aquimaris]MCC3860206.1 hypothetical protein [Pseudemcibacter aquimaris]WDU57531.1 hypothetical protein KW060_10025 [Pseudemcibacter aquimaris]